jgi:hypothetical protein
VTGSIERIELSNVLVRQGEVEDLRVLRDQLAVPRLRDRRNAALDAPTEEHLGGRPPETMRDRVTVLLARWGPVPSGLYATSAIRCSRHASRSPFRYSRK